MKLLFWGSLLLGLYFIYSFLKGQRSLTPSRLNLKALKKTNPSQQLSDPHLSVELQEKIRSLNVMFMYNGHNFDAHEVLGLQPGSSLEEVKEAFAKTMKRATPESKDFIETALRAVLEDHKRSRQ
jgi:hypothetical protein